MPRVMLAVATCAVLFGCLMWWFLSRELNSDTRPSWTGAPVIANVSSGWTPLPSSPPPRPPLERAIADLEAATMRCLRADDIAAATDFIQQAEHAAGVYVSFDVPVHMVKVARVAPDACRGTLIVQMADSRMKWCARRRDMLAATQDSEMFHNSWEHARSPTNSSVERWSGPDEFESTMWWTAPRAPNRATAPPNQTHPPVDAGGSEPGMLLGSVAPCYVPRRCHYAFPFDFCAWCAHNATRHAARMQHSFNDWNQITVSLRVRRVMRDFDGVDDSSMTIDRLVRDELPIVRITGRCAEFVTAVGPIWSRTESSSAAFAKAPHGARYVPFQHASLKLGAAARASCRDTRVVSGLAAGADDWCRSCWRERAGPAPCWRFWQDALPNLVATRRMIFIGDSYPRSLFRHLQAAWTNQPVVLDEPQDGSNLSLASQQFRAAFIWDPYLSTLADVSSIRQLVDDPAEARPHEGGASSRLSLLASFGAWPASHGQWSFAMYHQHMLRVASAVATFKAQTPEVDVEWLGPAAWPVRRRVPGFRISGARLRLFGHLGQHALSQTATQGLAPCVDSAESLGPWCQDLVLGVERWQHARFGGTELFRWTAALGHEFVADERVPNQFVSAAQFEILRHILVRMLG